MQNEIKIHQVKVSEIKENSNNPRIHPKSQIEKLANMILQYGFNNPIIVDKNSMTISAGHGRLQAAKLLELETVPVIFLEGFSEKKARAYGLADNKLAEESGWDMEKLSQEMAEMSQMGFDEFTSIGFSNEEVMSILQDDSKDESEGNPEYEREEKKSQSEDEMKFLFGSYSVKVPSERYEKWYQKKINELGSVDAIVTFVKERLGVCEE